MNKRFNLVKNQKIIEYFLLSMILISGFLVRLYKINSPIADWHSWRQADTASVSREYVEKGINFLYPKYHDISSIQTGIFNFRGLRLVEFPIYNALHAILFNTFNTFSLEVWGRLLSIFSAIVSAVILFFIGNKVLGRLGGPLSAFFYLFIPYNIYFTRVILPEPFAVMAGLLGILLFILFIEKEKLFFLYSAGVFLALSLLIKPFFIFYFVPLIYLYFERYGLTNSLVKFNLLFRFLTFIFVAITPLLLWRTWVNNFPSGIPHFEWAFNGDLIRFHPSFWRWIFGERLGYLILGTWGLIPFAFGIMNKVKSAFINYFLFGMFLYVALVATASVRHDYYQILTIPAISLALASGSLYFWKKSKLILLFSILIMMMTAGSLVKEFYKVNHPEIVEAGIEIDKVTPKDSLVIAPYNGDTAFLYQTKRWGWPVVDDSIDNMIKKGADYYVSVDVGSLDSKNFEKIFATVKKTDKYIILDLNQRIKK